MRKIITSVWITLDGVVSAEDGSMSWLRGDAEMSEYEQTLVDTADTLLLGRDTFNNFASYWPKVASGDAPADQLPLPEDQQRKYAKTIDDMDKVVVSKSGNVKEWRKTTVYNDITESAIKDLKQQGEKNIVIYGSLSVIEALAKLNLIDEYQLLVHPLFSRSGKPLFSQNKNPLNLELVSSKTFKSGVVLSKYRPA